MTDGGNTTRDGGQATLEQFLVDFLNTYDVETDEDALATDAQLRAWAKQRSLRPGERAQVIAVRDGLRDLAGGRADAVLPAVALIPVAAAGQVRIAPSTVAEAALSAAVTLSVEGRLGRLHLCEDDTCLWAFYDRSRNGSRHWCSMGECGNRNKARAYRSRKA